MCSRFFWTRRLLGRHNAGVLNSHIRPLISSNHRSSSCFYSPRIYFHARNYSTTNNLTEGVERVSPLLTRLKSDVKHALRNKDQVKLNVVRGILSDVTYATKSESSTSSSKPQIGSFDQDIYPIINRAIKRRRESIDQFSRAGRTDLVENEKLELEILQSYLPQQMSEQEIEVEVTNVIQKIGIKGGTENLGKVMKELNLDIGRAPKNIVAQVAKRILASKN
ncbi:509_t:CDS:2 [Acaulospora morrowiae]|uniref:Altered inheritance of mitochondria protein 41 n=1 Tax=Acaulospora morrowiae TaxID=94023 RepID=A0A9N9CJ48_9GLOM|nr:509_t:CDS:2 [Acaulospora morrowiae]